MGKGSGRSEEGIILRYTINTAKRTIQDTQEYGSLSTMTVTPDKGLNNIKIQWRKKYIFLTFYTTCLTSMTTDLDIFAMIKGIY